MSIVVPEYIETSRLMLERVREHHYGLFQDLFTNPEGMALFFEGEILEKEKIDLYFGFYVRQWDEFGSGTYAIKSIADDRYVGIAGFTYNKSLRDEADLAYYIHPDYWRRGFATEACTAIMARVFLNDPQEKLYHFVARTNEPSISLLNSFGSVCKGPRDIGGDEWLVFETASPALRWQGPA